MASAVYDKFREACLTKTGPSYSTGNIKVAFVSTKYTFSAAHQFLSSITTTQMTKKSTTNLASKTITNGVANAANQTLVAVPANTPYASAIIKSIVLYRDTGSSGTSELIAYIDTATGLPFTPAGINYTIAWSTGVNKIFKL